MRLKLIRSIRSRLIMSVVAVCVVGGSAGWIAAAASSTSPSATHDLVTPTQLARITPIKRPAFEGCSTVTCTAAKPSYTVAGLTKHLCKTQDTVCHQPTGILSGAGGATISDFDIINRYSGVVNGNRILVYAGGKSGTFTPGGPIPPPPTQGAIWVYSVVQSGSNSGAFYTGHEYLVPTTTMGAVKITALTTGVLTLQEVDENAGGSEPTGVGPSIAFSLMADEFFA